VGCETDEEEVGGYLRGEGCEDEDEEGGRGWEHLGLGMNDIGNYFFYIYVIKYGALLLFYIDR
jgi:hypothetical protein